MILILTKRRLVKEIDKMRWSVDDASMPPFGSNMHDYIRWSKGVSRDDLINQVTSRHYSGKKFYSYIIKYYFHLRPKLLGLYLYRVKAVLDLCIKDGYIIDENSILKLTSKGEDYVSWWYLGACFFKNTYVEWAFKGLITVLLSKQILPELISFLEVLKSILK